MLKIAVLVSGGGTNLQAIIDGLDSGKITNASLEVVISNNYDVFALKRAEAANIPNEVISPKDFADRATFNHALIARLQELEIDLVVLAGYLVVIPPEMVQAFPHRIINVHPSLIPSFCGTGFYGLKVHEEALRRGVKVTGATVHFVDSGTDTGPIILQKAVENGQKVMIRKGNDYAIAYADLITDMNLSGNAYAILDGNIPFYQIALHGMKDYTGDPINLAADYQEELLNAAEYGAGLNFTFMNASGTLLQETDYSGFYAADYTAWREKAAEIIIRYQTEMAGLNCTPITGHERLTENVAVTTYGNGTKVYVNYGDEDYRVGGLTIPARDYLVKGGAAQ